MVVQSAGGHISRNELLSLDLTLTTFFLARPARRRGAGNYLCGLDV